ncbi:MAG: hypothetical protein Q9160_005112 [Pyrenula sp. 1 TL-2023]
MGNVQRQVSDDKGARMFRIEEPKPTDSPNVDTASIPKELATFALTFPLGDSFHVALRRTGSLQPYVKRNCRYQYVNDTLKGSFVLFPDNNQDLQGQIPLYSFTSNETKSPFGPGLQVFSLTDSLKSATSNSNSTLVWYEPPPSSAYLGTMVSYDEYREHWSPGDPNSQYKSAGTTVAGCTIDATWEKALVNWTGSTGTVDSILKQSQPIESSNQIISISSDWAKRVSKLFINATGGSVQTVFHNYPALMALALSNVGPAPAIRDNTVPYFKDISRWQSLNDTMKDAERQELKYYVNITDDQIDTVFEYLRRTEKSNEYPSAAILNGSRNWEDPESLVKLHIQSYKLGFVCDISTIPVQLSLAVLIIYSLIVCAYFIYLFASGRSATSRNSIAEIVMLALNSKQPGHLESTSVGIGTMSKLREPINIRINEAGSVEMVFRNDPGLREREYSRVEPNQRY